MPASGLLAPASISGLSALGWRHTFSLPINFCGGPDDDPSWKGPFL